MNRIYFSICFSILFISLHAQQVGKHGFQLKNNLTNTTSYKANKPNAVNSLTCDTITTLTTKDTLTLYTITSTITANNGGYVTGNNGYGDSAIATFIPIDTSVITAGAQMTGVIAVFYRYGTLGTKGTQTINLAVFTGDTIHGPTTTTATMGSVTVIYTAPPIATATASLAVISATTPTNNAVDSAVAPILSSNYQIPYLFSFATPINIPDSGFFISLQLPTTVGDTVVLLCSRNDSSHVNYAWDYGMNGWRAYSNSNDWELYTSLTLFPVICYAPASIEQFETQNESFRIYPNPANTVLQVTFTGDIENKNIEIYNILGNCVHSQVTMLPNCQINIAELASGVYFIIITDNKNNRVTKKLIVE